jgi:hypothetical protein
MLQILADWQVICQICRQNWQMVCRQMWQVVCRTAGRCGRWSADLPADEKTQSAGRSNLRQILPAWQTVCCPNSVKFFNSLCFLVCLKTFFSVFFCFQIVQVLMSY